MINWIATNTSNSYYISKSHTCHVALSVLLHVLKISFCSTNAKLASVSWSYSIETKGYCNYESSCRKQKNCLLVSVFPTVGLTGADLQFERSEFGYRVLGSRWHLAGIFFSVVAVAVQILTKLETFVPIDLLLKMFETGIKSLRQLSKFPLAVGNEQHNDSLVNDIETSGDAATAAVAVAVDDDDEDVPNLKCFIMMLDILLKQVFA